MAKDRDLTRQILILHFSDLHFGSRHRFNPPRTAGGDEPDDSSFPSLIERLVGDLSGPDPNCPIAVCITGDLVETGSIEEFCRAEEFINGLAKSELFGKRVGTESVFLVPGNHDVQYDSADVGTRWQQWTEFYNRIKKTNHLREEPLGCARLWDRVDDLGALLLCVNSAVYVQKDKPDEDRGRLDIKQLTKIEEALEEFPRDKLDSAIRVALIHHHPVLIPSLAEPGRGYDAVHNSGKLLTILRRYGFHLVLHGHKHSPHTFTDDVVAAHQELPDQPILIVAGGSVASTELPYHPKGLNCYNQVWVKWHPVGRQTRVRVETRSLEIFNADGTERLPTRWRWDLLRADDRRFYGCANMPLPGIHEERDFDIEKDGEFEEARVSVYQHTRGNLPVVQLLPSLDVDDG
jgi:3',5'-cyclic AMP phosphodiesterase CpdA